MQMHSTRDISVLTKEKRGEGGREAGTISITVSRACLRKGRQFSGKIILLPSRFQQPSSKRTPASRNPSSSSLRSSDRHQSFLFLSSPFVSYTSLFTHTHRFTYICLSFSPLFYSDEIIRMSYKHMH